MGKSHKTSGLDQLGPKHAVEYLDPYSLHGFPRVKGFNERARISSERRGVMVTLATQPLRWQDIKTEDDDA